MTNVNEMTKSATVTAAAVRTWLATEAIVNTPFGTAKAFGAFYGQKWQDLIVGLTVIDPWTVPAPYPVPGWDDCMECMQGIHIFYTHADGWITSQDFVSRRSQKVEDLGLSDEQRRVLVDLRDRCSALVCGSDLKIDDCGRVWGKVYLKDHHKPWIMNGRDFVKHIRALEKTGHYRRVGTYAMRSTSDSFYSKVEPNGWVMLTQSIE